MKVTCQSCQAKYTIADEKVRGKVAKIRCKKCGTTIIVNGTEGAAAGPSEHPVADYTQQGANTEQWTVLVGDGDQRTVVAAELTKLYLSGEINYETVAWKDGMAEWLPISQIDALRSVLDNGPQPTMTPFADHAPPAASEPPPPEPVLPAPPMMNVAAAAPAAKPIGSRSKAFEPTAARRAGRGASTDLFGAPAQDEVLTSASANPIMHAPSDGGQDRLTGARNENSVLFSLSSLTGAPGGGAGPAPERASFDAGPVSSKADLRALVSSDTNGRPVQARSGLDDIMNLGGGGVYSPALMAPALAPPPVDFASAAETSMTGGAKPKSKTMLFAIIGVVLVGGAAFAYTSMNNSDKTGATASATPSAAPTAEPTAAKAPEPAAAEPTAESAPTVLAPGQQAPKPETEKKTAKAEKPDKPSAAPPAAAPAPAPDKPAAAPAPAAPAAASGADFNRAAALSALSAAASAAQSCKKPDGPTGSGKIAVTFANSGAATTAAVEGPPFAGTPVGGCVAARFRGVHVPPFGGATVTVHKTFIIN